MAVDAIKPEAETMTQSELDWIMKMPSAQRKYSAPALVEAALVELSRMVADPKMTTDKSKQYIDDQAFIERHQLYLAKHPNINPFHYLSNLRTMIRLRR